ncbi:polyamine (spermidine/putrescine) substrate-binding protein in Mollicutes [Candidatus Mycoplasma haematominutum]|uniref:Polyamine (Spermidine/putrescine) substrate binding protein in Mollicutes n=1 Tax=Candidatus Mycoplasma haematominutum 'Birmingham 1' TaxID=1116213 RepID=G8C2L7_9MOLU|nr:polyamine (spermidine/putrescine) substrate-binding protein in Mollicutes [Candidatus Mycoplasma haematominutum]CCE66565.1 polyamine (spermidine/putrescine) substrate binding protein in Mollicutes [Candidatus Mycoplasma haematominutum 'Birmingham 1']
MTLKLLWVTPITSLALPTSLISIQSLWNNELRLATYQAYISDEVASEAFEKFGIKTTYFENDKEVLSGFRSGTYDLAIISSSTLEEAISQNLVKKIDWSQFSSIPEKYKSKEQAPHKPFTEDLFDPVINQLFSKNAKFYEYGIPYFLSYLTFVYTGEKLKNSETLKWENLLEAIAEDSRFLPNNNTAPKLALIEDELTIFYISKLISGDTKKLSEISKNDQLNFYSQLSNLVKNNKLGRLGSNSIFLHPNSSLVSEMMLSGELNGAFMYNGDALYTYRTLKEDVKLQDVDNKFHIFEGTPSLWLLDNIAISAKIPQERETKIYEFLNQLLFEGVLSEQGEGRQIDETSWAWKNFDYLKYTPTLKSLQAKLRDTAKSEQSPTTKLSTQFDAKDIKLLFGNQEFDKCQWGENTDSSEENKTVCQVIFESSLSASQNLQLALAFQRWKNNL